MEVAADRNEMNAAAGPANDRLNQERMLKGLEKAVDDALNKNQTANVLTIVKQCWEIRQPCGYPKIRII
jgi:hypothetical protein